MPDGTIIEGVPDGTTKSQIMARFQKYQANAAPQAAPVKEEKGFFGNVYEDMYKRGGQLADTVAAKDRGDIGGARAAFHKVGTEAGAVGDIAGNILASAGKTAVELLPESIKQPLAMVGSGVRQMQPYQKGAEAVQKGTEAWTGFKAENPYLAKDIESAVNISGFLGLGGGKAVSKGVNKAGKRIVRPPEIIPSADELRAAASGKYKLAVEKGGILKPQFADKFVSEIEKLTPQTEIGKIVGGDSPFTQAVEKISMIRNKPITLEAAQEFDELLGDMIDGFTDRTTGKLDKQGRKLYDVQSRFRNMIEKADESMIEGGRDGFEALKEGRRLWSTSRKMADIQRIITRAEMTDNPATALKTGFRTLYNNPNRIKGYTMKERELIRKAATSSAAVDLLRTTLGSRLVPIIAGSTGNLGGAVAGQAANMAARGAAERVQLNKANMIGKEIAKNYKPKK